MITRGVKIFVPAPILEIYMVAFFHLLLVVSTTTTCHTNLYSNKRNVIEVLEDFVFWGVKVTRGPG